jgi:hypothetical protein
MSVKREMGVKGECVTGRRTGERAGGVCGETRLVGGPGLLVSPCTDLDEELCDIKKEIEAVGRQGPKVFGPLVLACGLDGGR